ncbi:DUF962 domain-containing protein [Legionella fallonii]|uniref:Membrane protein n=1 Tax=Legionella fallonii LLAP-10 TaxID=1212491 RepID=A0A098G3N5_9GAMM|nr:DUF962 domain-containing protein [Legionella fallonii]CEG57083.1 Membrane protein [Legionella fallonii LLAP-10]
MKEFKNFKEFYPFYLSQHQNPMCKRLHFVGTLLVCLCLLTALMTGNFYWLILLPFIGYGFAWAGHFIFEKNKPATFKHPFYSLLGDFVLFKDILLGKNKM